MGDMKETQQGSPDSNSHQTLECSTPFDSCFRSSRCYCFYHRRFPLACTEAEIIFTILDGDKSKETPVTAPTPVTPVGTGGSGGTGPLRVDEGIRGDGVVPCDGV